MKKITDKSRVIRMTMLFTILYMISYMTRINYGAVISEMVLAEGIQKSAASLALTASAVTYGTGQILSGFMGDRTEPKKLIFTGLVMTIMMNLAIPFCTTTYARGVGRERSGAGVYVAAACKDNVGAVYGGGL